MFPLVGSVGPIVFAEPAPGGRLACRGGARAPCDRATSAGTSQFFGLPTTAVIATYAEAVTTSTAQADRDVGPERVAGTRRWWTPGLVLPLVIAIFGCAATPAPPSPVGPVAESASGGSTTFLSVVDGDTIETTAGTVRIIGIDAPERGECGHDEASAAIGSLLSGGDPVTLELPAGENDRDRHERLMRYVVTGAGVDLGLMQLQEGNAIARYDSSDGYPAHPHEAAYHAAQVASAGPDGSVVTLGCRDRAPLPVAPTPSQHWWEQYTSCARLKKNTAGHPTGPFDRDDPAEAEIYDWFANRTGNRGDGDADGLACE